MEKKLDKCKVLTDQQNNMMKSAKLEKATNIGLELTTNFALGTIKNIVTKSLKDNDKNK